MFEESIVRTDAMESLVSNEFGIKIEHIICFGRLNPVWHIKDKEIALPPIHFLSYRGTDPDGKDAIHSMAIEARGMVVHRNNYVASITTLSKIISDYLSRCNFVSLDKYLEYITQRRHVEDLHLLYCAAEHLWCVNRDCGQLRAGKKEKWQLCISSKKNEHSIVIKSSDFTFVYSDGMESHEYIYRHEYIYGSEDRVPERVL